MSTYLCRYQSSYKDIYSRLFRGTADFLQDLCKLYTVVIFAQLQALYGSLLDAVVSSHCKSCKASYQAFAVATSHCKLLPVSYKAVCKLLTKIKSVYRVAK